MDTLFNANTVCTIITVVGSVITVSITYYKTKKIKIFDTYFANKTRTYENLGNSASKYCDNPSDENKSDLRCAVLEPFCHQIGKVIFRHQNLFRISGRALYEFSRLIRHKRRSVKIKF